MPRSSAGPEVNGVETDVVSVLMADNAFLDVALTAISDTDVVIADGPNPGVDPIMDDGPDRVAERAVDDAQEGLVQYPRAGHRR